MSSVVAIVKFLDFVFRELKKYLDDLEERKHQEGNQNIRANPADYFDRYRMPVESEETDVSDAADSEPDK